MATPELEILLKESEHVQQAIGRVTSTIHTLFGVVLPALFGVLFFTFSSGDKHLPLGVLGFSLAAGTSLAIMHTNSLWAEAFQYLRYQYGVLHPRMYQLVARSAWENFAQFMARTRKPNSWLPAILFYVAALGVAGVLAMTTILRDSDASVGLKVLLAVGSAALLALAMFSSSCTVRLGREANQEIRAAMRVTEPADDDPRLQSS